VKILFIFGTRQEAIKLAPVICAVQASGAIRRVWVTGKAARAAYDWQTQTGKLTAFYRELSIHKPRPCCKDEQTINQ
jgi:UDP-N-acetylglucosamine 2-epimerase